LDTLTPPTTLHPEELRLELAGELSRGERRVYDLCWVWLTRPGAPRYLTLRRKTLARKCRVCISTVARAFAAFRRLGLLIVQERWKRVGNLRRQISNLIALPFARPPERVKSRTHTPRLKKSTPNKVASGLFSRHKRAPARRGSGFVSAQTILKRWEKHGFPVGEPERPPES